MDQLAANCTALPPNLNDTSMCSVWPGRGGDWSAWEKRVGELVATKAGPLQSWGVWNVSTATVCHLIHQLSSDAERHWPTVVGWLGAVVYAQQGEEGV